MADDDKLKDFLNDLRMEVKAFNAKDLTGAYAIGTEQAATAMVEALEVGWMHIEATTKGIPGNETFIEGFKSAMEMAYIFKEEATKLADAKITPSTKGLR